MEPFETETINLSLRDAETGKPLTANVYQITFDDGTTRTVGVGQLVMAICLSRATEKENSVVEMMDKMAITTSYIEALSTLEQKILDNERAQTEGKVDPKAIDIRVTLINDDGKVTVTKNGQDVLDFFKIDLKGDQTVTDLIGAIESKLDEYNTMSQSQMVSLQSETNKRDQSYELISNVLKSLYTVMNSIVGNM